MNSSYFDKPIIILSAPRAGSTLLYEILSNSETLWTIGGESHAVIEGVPQLNVAFRNFDSNALAEEDMTESIREVLLSRFRAQLRTSQPISGKSTTSAPVRFLEKTPKNSLRVDFLNKLFPDALFIYLVREPKENISSIMEAWRSNRFVTYPNLPEWGGHWSLLLPNGWRKLKAMPLQFIAAFQWQQANESIIQSLRKIKQERWHMVSYQELISTPSETIAELCEFCKIPFDKNLERVCNNTLPHSKYTITTPKPNKWLKNLDAINEIYYIIGSTIAQINSLLSSKDKKPLTETHNIIRYIIENKKNSYEGMSRNSNCPCGSGERFKHCHGLIS